MFGLQKKTIIILAALISFVILAGILIWIFFPVILRWISPTLYTRYAFNETGKMIQTELIEINEFFGFPEFSDSDIKHFSAGLKDISAGISYGGFSSPDINLSKIDIGATLLYDRADKKASLDFSAGWDGSAFLMTLFTNVEQIALGINKDTSWVVNAKSFGKELAGIGLPVDEKLELDLAFLFPDIISDEVKENALLLAADFFKSLKFSRVRSFDHFTGPDGILMTTVIGGEDFQDFITEMIDCYFGRSDTGDYLRSSVLHVDSTDYELAVFINKNHIVQAVKLSSYVKPDSDYDSERDLYISLQFPDPQNLLDHIVFDISIIKNDIRHDFSLESKGRHVPVDGVITDTTTITGFDIGDVLLRSEIREEGSLSISVQTGSFTLNTDGSLNITDNNVGLALSSLDMEFLRHLSLNLSGDLTLSYGIAASELNDITIGAQSISDVEIFKFLPLFMIVWEILQQDHILMDMVGEPLYDLVLSFVFGNKLGSFINDFIDISGVGILDTLFDLFGGQLSEVFSELLESLMLDNLAGILNSFGDFINETIGERLNDLFADLFDLFN